MKNNKCNLNETFNDDKSFYHNESSDDSNMDKDKTIEQEKRVVITGDSMLNGIHEKGMSKNHKGKKFPGRDQSKDSGEHRSITKKLIRLSDCSCRDKRFS